MEWMWLVGYPLWLLGEVVYLIRHPWSFRWSAVFAWAGVTGVGVLLMLDERTIGWSGLFIVMGVPVYYLVKFRKRKRRFYRRGGG